MATSKRTVKRTAGLEAIAASLSGSCGAQCRIVTASAPTKKTRKQRHSFMAYASAGNWTRDPAFVTEIEKAKRSLARSLLSALALEGIHADIRFDTGFRVRKLPVTAEAALVIEFPGHFHCDVGFGEADADDEPDFVDGFSVQYTIAPRTASALWRPGTGLRDKGKYGSIVAVTTSVGTSKRSVSFIHQSNTLGAVLGKSSAVVGLVTDALRDTYEASVNDGYNDE